MSFSNAAAHRPESPPPPPHRLFRVAAWAVTLIALPAVIITPMTLHQQLTLSIAIFIAALVLNRFPGRIPTLAMIFLSVVVSSRTTSTARLAGESVRASSVDGRRCAGKKSVWGAPSRFRFSVAGGRASRKSVRPPITASTWTRE